MNSAETDPPLLPPTYLGGPAVTGDNCAREPIHIPGSIQPHGALLVAGGEAQNPLKVLQASENLGDFWELGAGEALGQPLEALLGEKVTGELTQALPAGTPDRLQFRTTLYSARGPLVLTAHRAAERLILELERPSADPPELGNRLRNAVFTLETAANLPDLLEAAVVAARQLSGFDRVMLYRFANDNSGEVMTESRREDLAPFVSHRFPESDISVQARALYVRHLLRLTANVDAPPSSLMPRTGPLTGAPTSLGGAVLRATSPMHLQYLRNMGVASSLSVSIVVGRWTAVGPDFLPPHHAARSLARSSRRAGRTGPFTEPASATQGAG